MKVIIKIFFIPLLLSFFIYVLQKPVYADDVIGDVTVAENGSAPNTVAAIEAALANHATPEEAAAAGVKVLTDAGYDGYSYVNPDGSIYVGCSNGSGVTITPPAAAPTCATNPSLCAPTCATDPSLCAPTCATNPSLCAPTCATDPSLCIVQPPVIPPVVIPPVGPGCNTPCAANPGICQQASGGCTQCNANGTCQAPPSAPQCGADCTADANKCQNIAGCNVCAQNPNGQGKTCQAPPQAPQCGANCTADANKCQNIAGCNQCLQNPNGAGKTCQAPPAPGCNVPCAANPAVCQGAHDGCTVCGANNTCQAPVCGADCSNNANLCNNIAGCNVCAQNPNSNGKTCQPAATATPTPLPFDNGMCKCDGLDLNPANQSITMGATINLRAWGKVLSADKNYAKIPQMTFTLYQGNSNIVNIIKGPDNVDTTVIQNDAVQTRYQADWQLKLPDSMDTSQTYRVQEHPVCARATASTFFPQKSVVLSAATEAKPMSFLDKVASFFSQLFGLSSTTQTSTQLQTVPTATSTPVSANQKENLHLGTFQPATSVTKGVDAENCTFIKFSFSK